MQEFTQTFEDGMFVRNSPLNPSRETILFIHGLGESGLCFEKIIQRPELASYNILLPDLPGYGRSPWTNGEPLSLAGVADHLATWLTKKISGPVILIGHSMGGVVALLLAERHPKLASRVIDIDGNKSPDDCVFSSRATKMGKETFLAGGFDKMRESIFLKGIDDAAQKGYYVSLRLADPRAYYHHSEELVRFSAALDIAGRLGKLAIPVYYLAGFPGGVSNPSRRLLDAARIKVKDIAPSGHWPFIDQENKFITALLESL